ncbi:MAG: cyclomaltodextrinase / maltogenic alpha-amylase / neopullulanase [Eubacteriaceae bacterium]|jgi:4-alpha-glucanotransferase|nr:cyclomaltodextrinase / maltogenic alpha-amylase / neopullulanase [Eubacteriaceae bacterium]
MNFIHNSFISEYRCPFGAVPVNSMVTIKVFGSDLLNVRLRTYFNDIETSYPMNPTDYSNFYAIKIRVPDEPGLLWYDFEFNRKGKSYIYGTKPDGLGGIGQIYTEKASSYQITIYDPKRKSPDWYKEGLMYQIFPDRFNRGPDFDLANFPNDAMLHPNWSDCPHYFKNEKGEIEYWDFFGGTLSGITEKLDYLKSLNVTILYLNPIFKAKSNHRYDTGDYMAIDPILGDLESFRTLVSECRKREIRIILDGVFSHTGDDSRYFNRYDHYDSVGAFQSEESPYFDWFTFTDYPCEYACWWGVENMPNTDEMNPEFQKYIFKDPDSVIRYWLKEGASGWRLDVADELPDAFISGLKQAMMEENEDSLLLGEVWEDASRKIAYDELRTYLNGFELDSVMNYPFRETFIDFFLGTTSARSASRTMMSLAEHYPQEQFMSNMNLIGSHDRRRILTVLGEAFEYCRDAEREHYCLEPEQLELGRKRLKLISLLQMTFPGVPCIYYGDEAGIQGFEDPFNRCTYPWGREDQELLDWYRQITKLRQDFPVFQKGSWNPLETGDDVFCFERKDQDHHCLCLFNRNVKAVHLFKHPEFIDFDGLDLITGQKIALNPLVLNPLSAHIILLSPQKRIPAE